MAGVVAILPHCQSIADGTNPHPYGERVLIGREVLSAAVERSGDLACSLLETMSRRRGEEVESDLKDMAAVDPMEAQMIGGALAGGLKTWTLQDAASFAPLRCGKKRQ